MKLLSVCVLGWAALVSPSVFAALGRAWSVRSLPGPTHERSLSACPTASVTARRLGWRSYKRRTSNRERYVVSPQSVSIVVVL